MRKHVQAIGIDNDRERISLRNVWHNLHSLLTDQHQSDEQVSDTLVRSRIGNVSDRENVQVDVSGGRFASTTFGVTTEKCQEKLRFMNGVVTHVTGIKMIQVKRK